MTWNTLTNLTQGQLVTETHMDEIRENIEHVGDNVVIGGVDAKTLTTPTSAARLATGTYTGDGNATQAITGVGFPPDFLMIYPQEDLATNGSQWAWKSDQDGTSAFDSGSVYETDNVISMDSDGFTVGDGTGATGGNDQNVSTVVYAYIAFKA